MIFSSLILRTWGSHCTMATATQSVTCLGKPHVEATLTEIDCSHCVNISLATLRARITFFLERAFSSGATGLNARLQASSRRPRSHVPRLRQAERIPVLFEHWDQRPLADASIMDSFGTMEDESLDNSMSVIASDAKEMSGTTADPAPSSSADPSDVKPGIFRILSKAVKELGLKWATQEEPTRNQLSGVGTPLWLNLTEIKEADNVPFLDFLVSLWGCLDLPSRDLQSNWLRHRSRPRLCNTSCLSAPALQWPPVIPVVPTSEAYSESWAPTALPFGQMLSVSQAPRTPAQADHGSSAPNVIMICWTVRGREKISSIPDYARNALCCALKQLARIQVPMAICLFWKLLWILGPFQKRPHNQLLW